MSSDPSLEKRVNYLITTYVMDHFCRQEQEDYRACIGYHTQHHTSNSWIDRSLRGQSFNKCKEYWDDVTTCAINDEYFQTVNKRAFFEPSCEVERDALIRCHQKDGTTGCMEKYFRLLDCGVIHQIRQMKGADYATEVGRAADAARNQNAQ
jgi:hypothetical protein